MAGFQPPSRSYSRHSSYSVTGDSIYPSDYTFTASSTYYPQPPVNRTAPYDMRGSPSQSDSDLRSYGSSFQSKEVSYLGNYINADPTEARPSESVGSYHSRAHLDDSGDSYARDLLQTESRYSPP